MVTETVVQPVQDRTGDVDRTSPSSSLCDEVYGRLDYLDRLVTDSDLRSRAALADTEISRLTAAWRDLLAAHQPNKHGRCPQCSGWRRPRRHPCSVWTTAHQHLIAADGPPPNGPGRHPAATEPPAVTVLGAS